MPYGFPRHRAAVRLTTAAACARLCAWIPATLVGVKGCLTVVLTHISLPRCLAGLLCGPRAVGPLAAPGTATAIAHTSCCRWDNASGGDIPRSQGTKDLPAVRGSPDLPSGPQERAWSFPLITSRPHFTAVTAVPGDIRACLETFLMAMTGVNVVAPSGKSPGVLLDPHSAQDPHSTESLSAVLVLRGPVAYNLFPPILFTE